jgi:uncharacterized phage-associated protein
MITPIFNPEKSLHAILYIANKLPPDKRDFHKIFKVLYFADREHLAEYGRTITGDTYVKMERGPVPFNIYDIFKAIKKGKAVPNDVANFTLCFAVVDRHYILPLQPANLDYVSKSDLRKIDCSLLTYGDMSYDDLTNASHGTAWTNAKDGSPISVVDILKEAGQEDDYIAYISEHLAAQHSLC